MHLIPHHIIIFLEFDHKWDSSKNLHLRVTGNYISPFLYHLLFMLFGHNSISLQAPLHLVYARNKLLSPGPKVMKLALSRSHISLQCAELRPPYLRIETQLHFIDGEFPECLWNFPSFDAGLWYLHSLGSLIPFSLYVMASFFSLSRFRSLGLVLMPAINITFY